MQCKIKNPANIDLTELGGLVQDLYTHMYNRVGFNKPPTMVFDSDPQNEKKILGKTAYYDPNSVQIHIYTDGRHPKDMLRSIAHELIHHWQNEEGRLSVGGYSGPGYYLKNKDLKKLEDEAMLLGNGYFREFEDSLKLKEKKEMSLKEWKNNELNKLLLKKFGILKEAGQPGYGGGSRKETEAGRQGRGDLGYHGETEEEHAMRVWAGKRVADEEEENINEEKGAHDDGDGKDEKCDHVPCKDEANEGMDYKRDDEVKEDIDESEENLQESAQKILKKNKRLRLRFK